MRTRKVMRVLLPEINYYTSMRPKEERKFGISDILEKLPEDAKVFKQSTDPCSFNAVYIIESESFKPIPTFEIVPEIELEIEDGYLKSLKWE